MNIQCLQKIKVAALTSTLIVIPNLSLANEINVESSARYRFQQVNDIARGDASASTILLRLGVNWHDQRVSNGSINGLLQIDHVHAFNENNYNSITVTRATSPIQDVPGSELNQVWLKYTHDTDWSIKLGRQTLGFDSQRHISSVEFWQNDQVFDALKFVYGDPSRWNVSYTYLNKVHRIFGNDAKSILSAEDIRFNADPIRPFSELGINRHDSHLFNVSYQFSRYLGVSAYAYLLGNQSALQFSSNTLGVRLNGEVKPGAIKYGYTAEYAYQETTNRNPWNYKGDYFFAELSAQYRSHKLAISHERLTENNGLAFATSLGDNHKFLGWADIFSSYTNADGLRDSFITYRGRKAKLRWRIMAHQFTSDSTGEIAGNEIDVEIGYRFTRKWAATIIGSKYMSEGGIEGVVASEKDLSTITLSINYNL